MPDKEFFTNRLSLREAPVLRAEAFKNLEVSVRADAASDLEREIAKSRIVESTLAELQRQPGFNPDVAISIVFGLKW